MFVLESHWIYNQAIRYSREPRSLLDVGSDSSEYRTTEQSYIDELYKKLTDKDIQITTLDFDKTKRPDVVYDISLSTQESDDKYDIVVASNILEHVEKDRLATAVDNLFMFAKKDGIVIITMPYNLPKHDRPIDNMIRPSAAELKDLIGYSCLYSEQWQDDHYREPFISNPLLAPHPIVTGGVFSVV